MGLRDETRSITSNKTRTSLVVLCYPIGAGYFMGVTMTEQEVKDLIASVLRAIISNALANGNNEIDVTDLERALEDL